MARPKRDAFTAGKKPVTTPSPLTIVPSHDDDDGEDPILDGSFIADGAQMYHKNGLTPLDLILAQRQVPVTEEMMSGSRTMVRALVEQGLVSHILLSWTREFQLAQEESIQWTKWLEKMMGEGRHLRASVAVKFGEHRMKLASAQLHLGQAIIKEVQSSALDQPSKNLVRSYLPRSVTNPIAEVIAKGQNPLVNGAEPSSAELAKTFEPSEQDQDTNFSQEPLA